MIPEKMDLDLQRSDDLGEITINAASLSNEEVLPYTVAYLPENYVKNSPLFKINYSTEGTYNEKTGELNLNNINLSESKGVPFLWIGRNITGKKTTLDMYSNDSGNSWTSFLNGNTTNYLYLYTRYNTAMALDLLNKPSSKLKIYFRVFFYVTTQNIDNPEIMENLQSFSDGVGTLNLHGDYKHTITPFNHDFTVSHTIDGKTLTFTLEDWKNNKQNAIEVFTGNSGAQHRYTWRVYWCQAFNDIYATNYIGDVTRFCIYPLTERFDNNTSWYYTQLTVKSTDNEIPYHYTTRGNYNTGFTQILPKPSFNYNSDYTAVRNKDYLIILPPGAIYDDLRYLIATVFVWYYDGDAEHPAGWYTGEYDDNYVSTGNIIPFEQARDWQKNLTPETNKFNWEDILTPSTGDSIIQYNTPATKYTGALQGDYKGNLPPATSEYTKMIDAILRDDTLPFPKTETLKSIYALYGGEIELDEPTSRLNAIIQCGVYPDRYTAKTISENEMEVYDNKTGLTKSIFLDNNLEKIWADIVSDGTYIQANLISNDGFFLKSLDGFLLDCIEEV